MKVQTLSIAINAPADKVYHFVRDARNLPRWVPFFESVTAGEGNSWQVTTPDGPASFEFVEDNNLGVVDHTIRFASGDSLTNPMRIVSSGNGCVLMFTLFQHAGMTDAQFQEDLRLVEKDLDTIRQWVV
ncbi:SRPBCC family protein [Gilvimarinus algae]|uniref:SRPBCC family protein n=1 Tax=Gilvimarinus algae TaxID=3058037 RepID=A0ABT8TH63_9GAMM|nr:SRPBCC family protein [Gilvimarinus sp. SDUM040014]MDO3381627.1 SRPBCC family protein [Gilvimarinus sp. SDUM040014]